MFSTIAAIQTPVVRLARGKNPSGRQVFFSSDDVHWKDNPSHKAFYPEPIRPIGKPVYSIKSLGNGVHSTIAIGELVSSMQTIREST